MPAPSQSLGRLGKYELLYIIGKGPEGIVYKARCIAEDLPGVDCSELVAVKRLTNTGHETEPSQFRCQTTILRELQHPNIVH